MYKSISEAQKKVNLTHTNMPIPVIMTSKEMKQMKPQTNVWGRNRS